MNHCIVCKTETKNKIYCSHNCHSLDRKQKTYKQVNCKYCNKQFEIRNSSKALFCSHSCFLGSKRIEKICPVCNISFTTTKSNNFTFCSKQCCNTNIRKDHGKKLKKTALKRYGVDSTFHLPEVKEKIANTIQRKYGVTNVKHSPEIQKKFKNTIKSRYTSWHKCRDGYNTILKNTYITPNFSVHEYKGSFEEDGHTKRVYSFACTVCGEIFEDYVSWSHNRPRCEKCFPLKSHSFAEKEFLDYVASFGSPVETHKRNIISPYEIDAIIPSKKIGFEYNGLYWHSEWRGKSHSYHLAKLQLAEARGIRLLQFWETEWEFKQNVVKSIIQSAVDSSKNERIEARKCVIKEIDLPTAKHFLETYHIQGYVGCSKAYALEYNNEIVSVMTFSKPRYSKLFQWEIARFANKTFVTVVGGASRLFKKFVEENDPQSVITYSDRRLFTGEIYKTLGFAFDGVTRPNYYYFYNGHKLLESRVKYQKHKLQKLLPSFDKTLTEWENMCANNYNRVWDCGNTRWIWKNVKTKIV